MYILKPTLKFPGLFGVLGLLLYPWGWGALRVKRMCGEYSEPYIPGECSIGKIFLIANYILHTGAGHLRL